MKKDIQTLEQNEWWQSHSAVREFRNLLYLDAARHPHSSRTTSKYSVLGQAIVTEVPVIEIRSLQAFAYHSSHDSGYISNSLDLKAQMVCGAGSLLAIV